MQDYADVAANDQIGRASILHLLGLRITWFSFETMIGWSSRAQYVLLDCHKVMGFIWSKTSLNALLYASCAFLKHTSHAQERL